jgi:GNAT superfamily N-acetyltransferase
VKWVRLRDGTAAVIWPLLPTDRGALREQYEHLSPKAQHQRFLGSVPHLTENLLDHLVGDVDGIDHVALVLFVFPAEGTEVPAGIARMVRYRDRPTAVDVAVTVADDWQGRGVATALLDVLKECRPPGVTEIVTEVAADNAASLAMLGRLGDVHAEAAHDGCLSIVVKFDDPESPGDRRQTRSERVAEPPRSSVTGLGK